MFWNRTRTLYLIRGISGSGKSSTARKLTRHNVAADDFPGIYNRDGSYNMELQSDSHRWCEAQTERWMQQGKRSIAVHNTFTRPQYVQSYLDLARKYGYAVQILHAEGVVLADGSRARNVHNVSATVLEKQKNSWENWQ
jgi:predicted kinase